MKSKSEIREWVWEEMERRSIARFPGARGRIPNFIGSEKACHRITKLSAWKKSEVVKISPDSPQREARYLALLFGKTLIMPTPRIKEGFLALYPDKINSINYREASTIKGAFRYGEKVSMDKLPNVDMLIVGSVCVDYRGNRIGKGGGYAELEYAILRELERIDETTPVISTIHDFQFVGFDLPRDEFDLGIDVVITPTKTVKIENPIKPRGIIWEKLSVEKLQEIPILREILSKESTSI